MDTQLGGTADHGARPLVGIIGGSGMYQLPGSRTLRTQWVDTPFGATSAPVTVAELNGRVVAFLPRHGGGHKVPPQQINYRANIWALLHWACVL